MKKIMKNIKISFEIMNLKYMLLTILGISIVMLIINAVTLNISGSNANSEMFGKLTFANFLPFLVTFSTVLIQINTYRGLQVLRSFSVGKKEIDIYYITTTVLYSLLIYIVPFILIGYPLVKIANLTNAFVAGHYLGNIDFSLYFKVSIMIYSLVLLFIMLFQLFTIVGMRFGVWINVGVILVSVATALHFGSDIFLAIRYGLDRVLVFGSLYAISLILFITCYYLQKGLEVTK